MAAVAATMPAADIGASTWRAAASPTTFSATAAAACAANAPLCTFAGRSPLSPGCSKLLALGGRAGPAQHSLEQRPIVAWARLPTAGWTGARSWLSWGLSSLQAMEGRH